MNNQFDELTKSLAQSVTRHTAPRQFGFGLAICFSLFTDPTPGSAQGAVEPSIPDQTAAIVWTDHADYAPGSTAQVFGRNFQPGESVTLQVVHADGTPDSGEDHQPWIVVAADDGTFTSTWHVCEDDCVGSTLLLSAFGNSSGVLARVLFTDTTASPITPGANLTLAWGYGDYGQLGDGIVHSYPGSSTPVTVTALPGGRRIASVAGGELHSLALADDGTLWAWGQGTSGQLGNGNLFANSSAPIAVNALAGGRKAVSTAGGDYHSLAVADDGTLWAWGEGIYGQLGNGVFYTGGPRGSSTPVAVNPLPGGRKAVAVAGGSYNSLALAEDGTLWAWGYGGYGQLGNGSVANSSTPVAVNALPGGRKAVAIAEGYYYCLALADDGTLWAWGQGSYGELGNGTFGISRVPVAVNALPGGRKAVAIAGGSLHCLALADDGTIWAWGYGGYGELGNGTFYTGPNGSSTPVPVNALPGGQKAMAIAGGHFHSVALADDGTIWAWGNGQYGQLGNGAFYPSSPYGSSSPVQVIGLPSTKRVRSIASGGYHSFALLGDANRPPIARCKNVTVSAGADCRANASIDDGSSDPDAGDTITLSQSPAGPYPLGSTTVTLTVTDNHGASSSRTAVVTVQDGTPPVIALNGPNPITVECHTSFSDPGVTASDNCDGDLTGSIVTLNPVDANAPGTYTVTYNVSDAAGNAAAQVARTVTVTDTTPPVPDVASLPLVTGQCSATVSAPTATDACDGPITGTTSDPIIYTSQGTFTVHWTYADSHGNQSTQSQTVIVQDTEAPLITCPASFAVNTDPGKCDTVVVFNAAATDNCSGIGVVVCNPPSGATFPIGTTTVNCTAGDAVGNTAACSFAVTVNVEKPTITCPANIVTGTDPGTCSALVPFVVTAAGNCSGVAVVCTPPSGSTFPIGTTTVNCTVPGIAGNTAQCDFTVTVENPSPVVTLVGPASGAVYPVGTPVNFSASFTDNAGDVHTAQWKFDTIVASGTVIESTHQITAACTFTSPGVYMVSLTVTDGCGNTASTAMVDGLACMVVIYDPNGGFVTGHGWINSPTGALVAQPALTGKANFGFVSKYLKGATVPSGETEFQFSVGNFNFHSSTYEWLVVSGPLAQYKGTGAVNGAGNYGFLLTAADGQINSGGGVDKFRIKIWDKATGVMAYDNMIGGSDDMTITNTQVIGGGSIVIQKAK